MAVGWATKYPMAGPNGIDFSKWQRSLRLLQRFARGHQRATGR